MRAPTIILSIFTVFAIPHQAQTPQVLLHHGGPNTSLRGLSSSQAKNSQVLWTTGSNGVILRSTDAGKSWSTRPVDNAGTQDFRGVRSFGADIAYVFSVGTDNKSHIYKTTNGGRSWRTQYSDPRPAFFLDGLVCRTEKDCFAISDPIDGKFPILHTDDGEHWSEIPQASEPTAFPTEGLFAASNTSLILCGPNQNDILFATGGPAARVFHSTDNAKTWSIVMTPILSGSTTAGIFSIACNDRTVVAVGGDYRNPTSTNAVAAYSTDLGATWRLAEQPPAGYRSGVTSLGPAHPEVWVAVGTNGADISTDSGSHWSELNTENANAALAISPSLVITVGPKAAINQIRIDKRPQPANSH
jgi:photosystem II stability/assembly factor-like uncharacterized protein